MTAHSFHLPFGSFSSRKFGLFGNATGLVPQHHARPVSQANFRSLVN